MHTSVIQLPGTGRRRGRYSDQFKAQVIASCQQPGISTAAVALANGLNANMLRRWIAQSKARSHQPTTATVTAKQAKAMAAATQSPFIALQLQAHAVAPAHIHIELQRAGTTVRVQWPLAHASDCAAWMREVLT